MNDWLKNDRDRADDYGSDPILFVGMRAVRQQGDHLSTLNLRPDLEDMGDRARLDRDHAHLQILFASEFLEHGVDLLRVCRVHQHSDRDR